MKKIFFILCVCFVHYELCCQVTGLQWANNIGKNSFNASKSITKDKFGNVYTTGYFYQTGDFDPGPVIFNLSSPNAFAMYIQKLDASGNFLWAKQISGVGNIEGAAIKLDFNGNIYTTGYFENGLVDFDPGPGTYTLAAQSNKVTFVLKLNANGDFLWAKNFINNVYVYGNDLQVDSNYLYVGGNFAGTVDFDPGPGVYNLSAGVSASSGSTNAFLCKLDFSGNFAWANKVNSTASSSLRSIAIDAAGNSYMVGIFSWNANIGAINIIGGYDDVFVSKLDAMGNCIWAKKIGNNGSATVSSIAADNSNNIYVCGGYSMILDADPGPGVFNLSTGSSGSAYILKLSSQGNFIWAKQIGSSGISACVLDSLKQYIYLTGGFNTTVDFDFSSAVFNLTSTKGGNVFILKIDTASNFVWAKNIGALNSSMASMAVDGTNNVLVTGSFSSFNDFDPNIGVYSLDTLKGSIFTVKIGTCLNVPPSPTNITSTANQTICNNTSSTLTASSLGTVNWFASPTSSIVLGSGNSFVTPILTVQTTYYAESNACTVSASRTPIIVFMNPSPTLTANSGSICAGQSFTLLPSGGTTTYTYSSGSQIVSPITSTNYSISSSSSQGCLGFVISSVTVNPIPTITVNNGTICSNETFTIYPTGAYTYTYSSGSNNVSPNISSNYTITGTDINGCANLIGAISQVTVKPTPTLTVQNASICVGTSTSLSAFGASNYYWWSGGVYVGGTSTISVGPTISTSYTVYGVGTNSCMDTKIVNVVVNQNCQDVWPGDVNSDGVANNLDVLELGLHYTQAGSSRVTTSNTWQSYFSTNWTGTIANGKNLNHSDCNGDGTINDNDTLAIYTNYGLAHSFKPAQTNTVNPQLSIVPDQTAVVKGTWGTASIYLGDVTTPINNINGVAFTINFSNTLIQLNSIYIEFQNSFLDPSNQNLDFRKLNFASGKIFTATTHTVNNNVNGYGKIATLHFQIKSTLTTDQVLSIGLVQANQSDASGNIVSLTSGTGTVMAMGSSVGLLENINSNLISISPNPTNGLLTINSKSELQKIEVISITGQVLLSEVPTSTNHTLHLENFANGIYFVNMYQNNRIIKREKVVLNK